VPISVALALACGVGCGRHDGARAVLLISIDSVRADHLGCYGYARATSPRIDRLSREGTLFAQAVSTSSWTLPAHMSLLTGLLPEAHGAQRPASGLDSARTPLAAILGEAGFRTAAFVSSPFLDERYGFSRGFETYRNFWGGADSAQGTASDAPGLQDYEASHHDRTGPDVVAAAAAWARAHRRAPFFLFVHLWEPHFDYIPPPPFDTLFVDRARHAPIPMDGFFTNDAIGPGMPPEALGYVVSQYDGEIAYADHLVGALLDTLDALGLADETLVLLTSDHGDEFFEHGGKGHYRTLYDEVIRVPLVARGPGVARRPEAVASQVSLIDVAPTVLGALGIPRHPEMMGEDLGPLLAGAEGGAANGTASAATGAPGEAPPLRPAPYAVSQLVGSAAGGPGRLCHLFAVRTPRWKTIEGCGDSLEIYDLVEDPAEVAPTHGGGARDADRIQASAALREAIERRASALPAKGARRVKIERALEERLRSLGYVE
jgi:arylsulfatase A-like enzyme